MGATIHPTTSRPRSRPSHRDAARRSRFRTTTRRSSSPSSSSGARRLQRRGEGRPRRRQTQSHLCDIERARTQCRGSRRGGTWFDSHHHERQGQTSGLCRALPAEQVRPLGRLVVVRHAAHRIRAHLGCRAPPHVTATPSTSFAKPTWSFRRALRLVCRTLVLFAHFDPQGIVDPYVAYYLNALHGLGATIVFVSGSPTLTPESVAGIRSSLCRHLHPPHAFP